MAADGSSKRAPGGGGEGRVPGQEQDQDQGTASSGFRLRAEEVVERGLRLYAHGDLVGALAEWRRALEIDQTNRRGRDYVTYVEDHFEILSEKFRAARERRGAGSGPAIEMEADDPMDDIDPYESIDVEGLPPTDRDAGEREAAAGEADQAEGRGRAPTPEAPHVGQRAAAGKHAAGRRPWPRRGAVRDSEEIWPSVESWPAPSSDTDELVVTASWFDELDDPGAGAMVEESLLEDIAAEDVDLGERFDPDPLDEEGEAAGPEPGSGEITLPARRPGGGERSGAPAQGSGLLDTSGIARTMGGPFPGEPREASGFDLSDFGGGLELERDRAAADEEEAWADGTPPTVDVDEEVMAQLRELRDDDELREVRVTFRRPARRPAGTLPEEEASRREMERAGRRHRRDDRDLLDLDDEADDRDDDYDEDEYERTKERRAAVPGPNVGREQPDSRRQAKAGGRPHAPTQHVTGEGSDLAASAAKVSETLRSFERDADPSENPAAPENPGARSWHRSIGTGGGESDGDVAARNTEERATAEMQPHRPPMVYSAVSIELVSCELLSELDRAMAALSDGEDGHLRERIGWLIDRARRENQAGHYPVAVVAVDLALDEDPESAVAQKIIHSNRGLLFHIYANYLGDTSAVPGLALPMSAIPLSELDHRAAFLLSRVDGVLSLEDVLDVAGMSRLEAFRHLSRLMLRGILEIRP